MLKKTIFLLVALTVIIYTLILSQAFLRTKANYNTRVKLSNLIVYANSSFMNSFGPGSELKAAFEKTCECTIEYVDVGSANIAIEKMKLDPSRRVDVVLGLDHLLLSRMAQTVKVQEIDRPQVAWREEIQKSIYPRFIPYDWSPMGFIYRKSDVEKNKIKVVNSLAAALSQWPDKSATFQDPALSAPGLELFYWLYVTSKDLPADFLKLRRIAHSFSASWSSSYGLFRKKQSLTTFSYLTSLLYHWQEEKNFDYQFMKFDEGHPVQIEYAAVPEACWNCAIAKNFVAFLLSPASQEVIARKNYMLPVIKDVVLNKFYDDLPKVNLLGNEHMDKFLTEREKIFGEWSATH